MSDEGARIVAVDVSPVFANGCAEAIKKRGGQAIGVVCDVTEEDQVKAAIEQTKQAFGGVDILVNGAAMTGFGEGRVLQITPASFRRQIDVIMTGALMFTQNVARLMIDQGRQGNIINIISSTAHQGQPGTIAYSSAKAGMLSFTRAAAMELAPYRIRVNSLTPTMTDAHEGYDRAEAWGIEWKKLSPEEMAQRNAALQVVANHSPMQKLPQSRHYAKAAVFLASDDAEMITGFDMRIDGGNLARYWGYDPVPITVPAMASPRA
jgi:NAD(P)-dependent dehydrogenase (short-subunit alcohol dehydrogenase family)